VSEVRVQACVDSTKYGAFVGDAPSAELWNSVGQDDDALRTACTDIGAQDPERLRRITEEWDATQQAMMAAAAAVTTTIDDRCDPSYPAMCIRMDQPDLDCSNVGAVDFPVNPPDRHGFDTDGDGFGCVPGADTG
jgi:hypothetical protein